MKHSLRLAITLVAAILLLSSGCTEDDEPPRDPSGGTGGTGGVGSSNDGDPDAGEDTGADTDEDVGTACELVPSDQPGDERFPCCFTDRDCWESGAQFADQMRCYYAECTEGGEGTCRIPPQTDTECWSDRDCPDDHHCPWEQFADDFHCEEPTFMETPEICTES